MDSNRCIGKYTSSFDVFKDRIGNGRFGQVYRGYQINNPQNKVAIKTIKITQYSSQKDIKNQIASMLKLQCEQIVKVLSYSPIDFGTQKRIGVVIQLMDGNITQLKKQHQKVSESEAIQWIWKITQSYKKIFEGGLIHRDLKPQNILFKKWKNNELIIKIADFGNSRISYSAIDKKFTMQKGTQAYMSLQNYKGKEYTEKADVYSLGAILFQFLNGFSNNLAKLKIIDQNFKFDQEKFDEIVNQLNLTKCEQFLRKCLKQKEIQRYNWVDIFTHQIFVDKGYLTIQECLNIKKKYQKHTEYLNNLLQKNYLMNIPQNFKKISITPNRYGLDFQNKNAKNQKGKVCNIFYTSRIYSNEELPIQGQESFYFSVKAVKIRNDNDIMIGIAYLDDSKQTYGCDLIAYSVKDKILFYNYKFLRQELEKGQVHRLKRFGDKFNFCGSLYPQRQSIKYVLQRFPCQLIVFVSKQLKYIFIIYNEKVQMKIPLTQKMINHPNKCLAFVQVGSDSEIQFI